MNEQRVNKDAILAAHVQFELDQLRGENLRITIANQVGTLYTWLAATKINEVISPIQLLDYIQRYLVTPPVSAELLALLREAVLVAFESLQDDQTTIAEALPRAVYDHILDNLATMDSARSALIHQLVGNSVYSMLIADVLYHGIKNYMLFENALARNLPGATSLLKFGQNALNAAVPKLEKSIDRQLITFINGNIKETIRESEDFLNRTLDEALIHKVGDEIWTTNAQTTLSELSTHVTPALLNATVDLGVEFWLSYRQTQSFQEIAASLVRTLFLKYGKQDIATWLAGFGLTEAVAAAEGYAFVLPFIEHELANGNLEQAIRQHLDAFYSAYFSPAG